MYAEKSSLDDGLYRRSEERFSHGVQGVMMGKKDVHITRMDL